MSPSRSVAAVVLVVAASLPGTAQAAGGPATAGHGLPGAPAVRTLSGAAPSRPGLAVATLFGVRSPDPVPGPSAPPAPPTRQPGITPPLTMPFQVAPGVARRTLAFGSGGLEQTLDVYTDLSDLRPRPTVLLIHGGSWQIGDSTEWSAEAISLVRDLGWTAVAVNYRLTPGIAWPGPLDDVEAALQLVRDRAHELSVDPARIGALGDSAGGHLAALIGEPRDGRAAVRSVVTWSGINDLAALTQQASSGGCGSSRSCDYSGLARKVTRDVLACVPSSCPDRYAAASPATHVSREHAATLAITSEDEQIDPRQSWVMDVALRRKGVPSRVHVLPGALHARGFQSQAWQSSLRFLAATLTPERAPAFPRPEVTTSLSLVPATDVRTGTRVTLAGVVTPRQVGSSVALQVRDRSGAWQTVRTAALRGRSPDTTFDASWTPAHAGTYLWRARWIGGGGVSTSDVLTVQVR